MHADGGGFGGSPRRRQRLESRRRRFRVFRRSISPLPRNRLRLAAANSQGQFLPHFETVFVLLLQILKVSFSLTSTVFVLLLQILKGLFLPYLETIFALL